MVTRMTTVDNAAMTPQRLRWDHPSVEHPRSEESRPLGSVAQAQHRVTASPQPPVANALPLTMSRPEPVAATTELTPASVAQGWDTALQQALESLPDPDSWFLLGLGPDMLAGSENLSQRAESRLQSGRIDAESPLADVRNPLGQLSFKATLESGAQITFEVTASEGFRQSRGGSMAFRAIDVRYASDAELSEAEQEALNQFSAGLGRFARDFARNGSPDVSLLNLTDSPLLTQIDLRMQSQTADGKTHSVALSYQSTTEARQLDLRWDLRSLSLSVDADDAFTKDTMAEALSGLRQSITESLGTDKASQSDQNVLLDALSLFNSASDETGTSQSLPKGSDALLTGLPDYTIEFKGAVTVPEALKYNEHFQKYSGVRSFELSQSSRIIEKNGRLTLDQTQQMSLDAAYFTALPHLELPDFENQNFNWTLIKERHEVTTQQVWEDNDLTSATVWRSSESAHTTQTWSEGEQIDEVTDSVDRRQLDDLTEWVKAQAKDNESLPHKAEKPFTLSHHWLI